MSWQLNYQYTQGDKITYNGNNFECLVNNNLLSPDKDTIHWKKSPPPPPTNLPSPSDTILKLVSIAENSSTDWKSQINYIENINDGRGYTISIVGFCTGTGDFIQVLQRIKQLNSNHQLVKFIPLVQIVDGTASVKGLENLPNVMKNVGINDIIFNKAMWYVINKLYWGPAQSFCKSKGITSQLGYYIAYDTILNFGDLSAFNKISGSNETDVLTAFLILKQTIIEKDHSLGDTKNNRVDMQKSLLTNKNFGLISPMKVSCYGDSFTL